MDWGSSLDLLSQELVAELPEAAESCLELGCGSGAFSRIIRAHLPQSRIVGLDVLPRENCYVTQFVQADVGRLPFGPASFNAAAGRFTLVYSEDLEAVVRELARVLRPGAIFVSQEMLLDSRRPGSNVHPQLPSFLALADLMGAVWRKAATPLVPLRLPSLLKSVGFSEVRLHPRPAVMVECGVSWLTSRLKQLDDVSDYAIRSGVASADDISVLKRRLSEDYGDREDVAGIGLTTLGLRATR